MPQRGAIRHRLGGAWGGPFGTRGTPVTRAGEREQFGKPIAGFQLTQAKIAEMYLEYAKGLLLANHLGRRKDAHTPGRSRSAWASSTTSAKPRHSPHGANNLGRQRDLLESPVIRHMNNLESVLTYEGTVEMHTLSSASR
ncbi:MAG: acyl-CoA dehydrogenase family protein [Dermatophilaceae bacterium]